MEPFYGFKRTVALRDATSSLQAFEAVLALGDDPKAAQEILRPLRTTTAMTVCLPGVCASGSNSCDPRRKRSSAVPSRPEPKSGLQVELEAQLTEISILKERLTSDLPEDESEWTNEERARWLLAQLLEWHRREDKSMFWEYYRLCDLSDDELIEDKNSLGGLVHQCVAEETKGSFIHRYSFPIQTIRLIARSKCMTHEQEAP
jgi:uncharacterized protein